MLQCRNATINDDHLHIKNYCLFRTIGRGSFSTVKLAQDMRSKQHVAVKIIDKTDLDSAYLKTVCREADILQMFDHPNIVKIKDSFNIRKTMYLVLEYISGGNLAKLNKSKMKLEEEAARPLFRQLVCAVQYIHQKNIAHLDLKPNNILLDTNNTIKVADFGMSDTFTIGKDLETPCGALYYRAPEILQGKLYNGQKADAWSLGIILYKLVTGSRPFTACTEQGMLEQITNSSYHVPFYLSCDCENLLNKLLVVDPRKRWSLEEVMKHRWMNTGYENDILQPYMNSPSLPVNKKRTMMPSDFSVESVLPFGTDDMYRPPQMKKLKRRHFFVERVEENLPMAMEKASSSDSDIKTPIQMSQSCCKSSLSSEDNHDPAQISNINAHGEGSPRNIWQRFCNRFRHLFSCCSK